jgi:hypothetical protein
VLLPRASKELVIGGGTMSKISFNEFDNKLTIGSWKLTRRGTLIMEALFLLALLALVGFAGYIETMEVGE